MKHMEGLGFVTLMLVIAILSLFLRIALEQIIKITITQNESYASETLKLISTALENYAADNQGIFPSDVSILTKGKPAYLDKDYINESPFKGYNYSCLRLEPSGYSCSANPVKCNLSGKMRYNITTGGSFTSEECEQKETVK